MKLQDISRKTIIVILLFVILILFIYFYSNKQENLEANIINAKYKAFNDIYVSAYPNRGVMGLLIDTEQTRTNYINSNINFQPNQIIILGDIPNNKIMVFDFDNAIAIYDFNNNMMFTFTPKDVPNVIGYQFNIITNPDNYVLNISYMLNDNSGTGNGIPINKTDFFNPSRFADLLLQNNQLDNSTSNFDPDQLQILPPHNKQQLNNASYDQDIGDITSTGLGSGRLMSSDSSNQSNITTSNVGVATPVKAELVQNPISECISQEIIQSMQSDFDKLYQPTNSENLMDRFNGFLLNYKNYNIIKKEIDLIKTFSDEQMVCLLTSTSPNLCNHLKINLEKKDFTKFLEQIRTSHEILSLYQNQILDIKNIILPRFLNVLNKCNTLTNNEKIIYLTKVKDMLYIAEYLSSILGNNWDLIKNIEDTINNLNLK